MREDVAVAVAVAAVVGIVVVVLASGRDGDIDGTRLTTPAEGRAR
jgi:hypothetical protein